MTAQVNRGFRISHMFRTVAWSVVAGLLIGGQWPEFRGPDGAGKAQASGLPLTWSETSNIRWKTAVHGRGWSSPVVLDGRVTLLLTEIRWAWARPLPSGLVGGRPLG